MAYDRADWHYGGEYPSDLPVENGGTHIGFFLAWAIHNDLVGKFHLKESVIKVKSRKMTGREFLFKECDEKFWEEDLSDEGNSFASDYYVNGIYFSDYTSVVPEKLPSMYHFEDNWDNLDRVAKKLRVHT
ncbi:MAG: hypothetical protein OER96_01650 [Gammaproteobacteria bacterium]|nr:hypothetical protein [Gammaproteobacteria bacterium]